MSQKLQIDSQWVVEKLTNIGVSVAVLPEMKEHLKRLNDTVAKQGVTIAGHEMRILEVERIEDGRKRSWKTIMGVALRIVEGVLLAAILLRLWPG